MDYMPKYTQKQNMQIVHIFLGEHMMNIPSGEKACFRYWKIYSHPKICIKQILWT